MSPDTNDADAAASEIRIRARLFGGLRVSINDNPVKPCRSEAGWMMLAGLLMNKRFVLSSDNLEEMFWPECAPESRRNSRNVAACALRNALRTTVPGAESLIEYKAGRYCLDVACVTWVDLHEFERMVVEGHRSQASGQLREAASRYEVAVSLYEDDLLADYPYHDWIQPRRNELREAYTDMLDRLSHIYLEMDDSLACTIACRRILEQDCAREHIHRVLMRCYCRQNKYSLALRQYEQCARALREELGVPPSPETRELHARILRFEPV